MRTIGRVLTILVVFSVVAGLLVTAVNASGMNVPNFGGTPQFRPDGGGFRPPQGGENRPERRELDFGGLRFLFGVIRNIIVIGFLVTVIVWPKSVIKKKKKAAAVITANGKS